MSYPLSKDKKEIVDLLKESLNADVVDIVKVFVEPRIWIQAPKGGEYWTYKMKGGEVPKGMREVKI